ncbi:hypothetical protein HHI36_021436 [Cryptolaemus montrouzieri]|uniref:Uncharacterized protein n=1 Tax=Cryptolaemus montrouzieri TaxID=559131 RepID=A0ABD2MWS1_9CUCU
MILMNLINFSKSDISDNTIEKNTSPTVSPLVKQKELQLLETLKKQIKTKEDELKKADTINKHFEKMLQLVTIMGQIDTFLTERTRALIRKMAILAEDEEADNEKFREEIEE